MDLRKYGTVALTIIALVAVMVGVRSCVLTDAWEERVEEVQDSLDAALDRTGAIEAYVEALVSEADRLEARATDLSVYADSITRIARRSPATLDRVVRTRDETPLDLISHPAILARDSLIDDLVAEKDQWREGYEVMVLANTDLANANSVLRASNDSLVVALHVATAAAIALDEVVDDRPGAEKWWMPEVGVGPSIGVGIDGGTYAGVGLNLSWEIPIG